MAGYEVHGRLGHQVSSSSVTRTADHRSCRCFCTVAVACLSFFYSQELHKAKAFLFSFFPVQGHMALFWLLMGKAGPSVCIFVLFLYLTCLSYHLIAWGWGCLAPLGSRHHMTSAFPCFCICPHAPSSAYVRMLHPLLQIVLVLRGSTPAYLSGAVGVWAFSFF